jgi:hypothetical protein
LPRRNEISSRAPAFVIAIRACSREIDLVVRSRHFVWAGGEKLLNFDYNSLRNGVSTDLA